MLKTVDLSLPAMAQNNVVRLSSIKQRLRDVSVLVAGVGNENCEVSAQARPINESLAGKLIEQADFLTEIEGLLQKLEGPLGLTNEPKTMGVNAVGMGSAVGRGLDTRL